MLDFIKMTEEYRGFGLNPMTFGFIGAMIVLALETWGIIEQIRTMWRERSAEALSVYWFGYTVGFMLASIPYGISIKSGSVMVASTVFVLALVPLLWGIYKFRGYTAREWLVLTLYTLMPLAMLLLPWKDAIYLACSMGMVYSFASQPWIMWRKKSRGVLEIKLLATFLLSLVFWTTYAFAINALALMILNPLLLVILSFTTYLWWRYRDVPSAQVAPTG